MAGLQELPAPPGPRTPEGKRLRELFRYASVGLDLVHAQLVDESVDRLGKSTVLSLFERNKDMKQTVAALAKLTKACFRR